ncbi:TPA: hypothetical protein ACKP5P_004099, partial [Stenotrophomonas maltophilia]
PRLPTRPWTGSCGVHHGKSQARAEADRFARKAVAASQSLLLLLLPFPLIFPWWFGHRNLSGAGRVGLAGYPRHGVTARDKSPATREINGGTTMLRPRE